MIISNTLLSHFVCYANERIIVYFSSLLIIEQSTIPCDFIGIVYHVTIQVLTYEKAIISLLGDVYHVISYHYCTYCIVIGYFHAWSERRIYRYFSLTFDSYKVNYKFICKYKIIFLIEFNQWNQVKLHDIYDKFWDMKRFNHS